MLQEKKRAAKRSELFLCICGLCAALKSAASSAGIWLLLLLMRRSRKKSFSVRLLPHQRQLPHSLGEVAVSCSKAFIVKQPADKQVFGKHNMVPI